MAPTDPTVWEGATERLDRALAHVGLARSRSHAASLIDEGRVTLNARPATKSGQRVSPGDVLLVAGSDHYVSRAAHKLISALDTFAVDPAGRLALDLGASTGGFTQVLLERGARMVQAIDVGHGQIDAALRADPNVRLVEGCNARDLSAERLAGLTGITERPTLVVADLSFISLTLILPAIAATAADTADLLLLIKPQFEVGRTGVRDGIVVAPERRSQAIRTVLAAAANLGYHVHGLERSPIVGGSGNIEYLVHFQREPAPNPTEWEGRLSALTRDTPTHAHTDAEGEA